MKKINESGPAKNIAAFEQLIAICKTFGSAYNPSKPAMQIAGLELALTEVRSLAEEKRSAKSVLDNSTNSRVIVFRTVSPFSTQLINALEAYGAADETLSDARGFINKLTGRRATEKEEVVATAENPDAKAIKTISVSQLSYDNKLENFARLIAVAKREPSYKPNEEALKTTGLDAKYDELQNSNTEVINSYSEWSKYRILLHEKLYNPITGIVAIANDVKKYTKAIFGATSPQYKQLSAIQFRYGKL